MRGRKPKPTHLKLLDGNPGKRAINRAEPKPEGDLFEAPEWMTERQVEGWTYAIANAPLGLLKRVDRAVLTMWIVAEDLHREAAEAIAVTGTIIQTSFGPAQNPYVSVLNKQVQLMVKLASEMGFTPASRTRIQLADGDEKKKPDSPFAQFKR